MLQRILIATGLATGCLGAPALADDVTGVNQILCAVVEVNFCSPDVMCEQGSPWLWNVPDFIEVDLTAKELRTTQASTRFRKTPIVHMVKQEGQVVLAGLENGRAFTFMITEKTGEATISVAAYGEGGIAFGSCTPMMGAGR
jgi:hypothetical protein